MAQRQDVIMPTLLQRPQIQDIDGDEKKSFHGDFDDRLPDQGQRSRTKQIFGDDEYDVVRAMPTSNLVFIAIGGSIGTGIFLSTGTSIATAGPGGALVAYGIVGLFVMGVMMSLGEMASYLPVSGAFSAYATRYVSPVLGATLGLNYFLQWAFSIPSEIVSAAIIINFWTDKLTSAECAVIIIVPIFALQLINVRVYGVMEYWFALIKVVLIVVFIIVGLLFDWGAIKNHPGPGLSNFNDGPFSGGFGGLVASFSFAFYSYGGVELVALASGESKDPHKSVPKAIKGTFLRILLFYIGTVLVIGLCINQSDPTLFAAYDNSDVAASPITVVFQKAGFGAAVQVVNAVLLTAVLSATNSCFYASSRMLRSLAKAGQIPSFFGWTTKRGVPVIALLVTLAFACLTFLGTIWGEGVVFTWFISLTGVSALLTWASIAGTHLRFRYAFKAQGRDMSDLPFRSYFFPWLQLLTIGLALCMFGAQGYAATTYDDGHVWRDELANYIGFALFIVVGIGYAIHHRLTKSTPMIVPLLECDLDTDAVWPRGGGALAREAERATGKPSLLSWARWRESLY